MKRLPRDPVRFDVFAAFAEHAAKRGVPIHDKATLRDFGAAVQDVTEKSLGEKTFVFGNRVQVMFETIVAALGEVRAIKQEDSGSGYFADDIKLPDYRLVLADGSGLLVEVKNHHQRETKPHEPFEMEVSYLRKLEAYSRMMNTDLTFAIYWSAWNLWTLTSASAFTVNGDHAVLTMADAFKASQMARIGDVMLGTRAPLRFRVETVETDRQGVQRRVVIDNAMLLCEDRPIAAEVERRIAMMLMLYGDWREEQVVELSDDDKLTAVEYRFAPPEEAQRQNEQGFEMNSFISSMVSKLFREATVKDGVVTALHMEFTPGEFGRLIPTDYDQIRVALPLWRCVLQPRALDP